MSEQPMSRRRFPRIASQHSVLVKRLGGSDLEEFARTKTMAVGGCSFVSDEPIGVSSALELLIAVDHRVITARGRVIYERGLEDGRTEVGVEFVKLDDRDAEAIQRVFEHPVASEE